MTEQWGEDYVNLALRMEKHFDGFVDAYCGPPELKARCEKEEKRSLDSLLNDAVDLLDSIPRDNKPRGIYLEKQVTGILTTIRVLQGEEIDYIKQVELFYDTKPEYMPDSHFEKQKSILQDIFKGQDLSEALEKWRHSKEVPKELLEKAIAAINKECRKRTVNILSLPEGETVDFVLVQNKPWSGYNWYLGDYKSRVEINTDIPLQSTGLASLVSHEGYPGHHTEHTIKEKTLYREKGFTESCIFVYNTPECLISEGIANANFTLIFKNRKEAYSFLNENLGFNMDVNVDAEISEALHDLFPCSGNASLMIHKDNADTSEAVEYLVDVGLSTRERAEKQMEFITNPLFRAYIFNYYLGEEVVSNALTDVDPKIFYEEQICPSNIKYYRK